MTVDTETAGRDAVQPARPRRALILAGGGYKVAYQAGVMQVWLDEAGIEFDHGDGASGGNLNLAMWVQGMSGTRIADNWRSMRPIEGIGLAWREWLKTPLFGGALMSLDRFKRNVLTRWGLDWDRIRASERDASFNIYDFTAQELVAVPPGRMDPDLLMAAISIPMWFKPLVRDGRTLLDAVFLSDANIEDAIERGADELWVIWTVSEKSTWRSGFVGIYFDIIEIVANGNFRRVERRIARNNAAIAAGSPGEFGRHIELKVIRAEVPLQYLIVLSGDRVAAAVERGVADARRWCLAHGIALKPPSEVPATDDTRLRFTEDMKGFITVGATDPDTGAREGQAADSRMWAHLTITLDGVRSFIREPDHLGSATGYVDCGALGGRLSVVRGTFNLFVDQGDPATKEMWYRLWVNDPAGKPLTVSGVKHVHDDPGFDVWSDTSTLFTMVYAGHVEPDAEASAEVVAAGVIHVHMLDFLHQLTTFRVEAGGPLESASLLAEFGTFFMGQLWDVYANRVLAAAPV